jgi:hypothetical protein
VANDAVRSTLAAKHLAVSKGKIAVHPVQAQRAVLVTDELT